MLVDTLVHRHVVFTTTSAKKELARAAILTPAPPVPAAVLSATTHGAIARESASLIGKRSAAIWMARVVMRVDRRHIPGAMQFAPTLVTSLAGHGITSNVRTR